MTQNCIDTYIGLISGGGTLIASLIAWRTLSHLKKQRKDSLKPTVLFKMHTTAKLDINNIANEIPIKWKGEDERSKGAIIFQMFNAGKDIAKNIEFEFKLNINAFIDYVKSYDDNDDFNFFLKKKAYTIKSEVENSNITVPIYSNTGTGPKLEYLLPMSLDEKPSGFSLPRDYLTFFQYLIYLLEKHKQMSFFLDAPKLLVKTTFEDIEGNKNELYNEIDAYYADKGKIYFNMKEIKKNDYKNFG